MTCMNNVMVYTAYLLCLKPFSEQAEQLQAVYLAKGHAKLGIEHEPTKFSANTQPMDHMLDNIIMEDNIIYIYIYIYIYISYINFIISGM